MKHKPPRPTAKRKPTSRRQRSVRPKHSKEYLQGFHDCLTGITSLVVHLPVFMQCAGSMTTPKDIDAEFVKPKK